MIPPSATARQSLLSAAVTLPWMRQDAQSVWVRSMFISYTAVPKRKATRLEEVHHAKEEGIEFHLLENPVQILNDGNGQVCGIECLKMELGEPDASGRRSPIPIEGSNYVLDVDTVIMSLGTSPNPLIRSTTKGLETNRKGCLVVNEETNQTTREGVYAGRRCRNRRSNRYPRNGRREKGSRSD